MSLAEEVGKDVAKKAGGARWTIASIVIVVLSFGLLLVGFFIRTPGAIPIGSVRWFGDLAWELGKLGVAGGIIATLIRMFNSINFLQDALEKFVWSDAFLAKRNDMDDLWEKLTAFRYLRFSNLHEKDQKEFLDRLKTAIREGVGHEEGQFARNQSRSIDLTWENKREGIIRLTERQEYEIIPRTSDTATITTKVNVHGKLAVGEYNVLKDEIFLTSDKGRKLDLQKTVADDHIETKYELSGARAYSLRRDRVVTWALEKDPVLTIISRHVCDGATLEMNCPTGDIRTRFRENGKRKLFVDQMTSDQRDSRPGDQRQLCKGILLPGNGFSVYLERIP